MAEKHVSLKDRQAELAGEAAERVMARKRERLGPAKLKAERAADGTVTIGAATKQDELKALASMAVTDGDALNLLSKALLSLSDKAAVKLDPGEENGMLALLHELEPRDAAETMLCCQMVASHLVAMECFRRSTIDGQTFDGRDVNLRHAERLTRIFAQQIDALNKHRGKGQQKVTVEHVTVNEGGQAVVGSVSG